MSDIGEFPMPAPVEVQPTSSGVIQKVTRPQEIGPIPETKSPISDVVVQARAKSNKKHLGEKVTPNGFGEGYIVSGGQDAAGAMLFEGGRIQALLVAADGCSFGDERNSALAAKNVPIVSLREGPKIAAQTNPDRDQIKGELEKLTLISHDYIQKRLPDGTTTSVIAALSQETTAPGQAETYLHYAACGDPQIMVISEDPLGETRIWKIVQPADRLDRTLRDRGIDPENMVVSQVTEERDKAITQLSQNLGIPKEQAEEMLTQTGIYTYLGDTRENPKIRTARINLTRELRGHKNVKVILCSDNAGDKLSPEEIKATYKKGKTDNETFAREINSLMGQADADDGCLAIASVEMPPLEIQSSFISRAAARVVRNRKRRKKFQNS